MSCLLLRSKYTDILSLSTTLLGYDMVLQLRNHLSGEETWVRRRVLADMILILFMLSMLYFLRFTID